MSTITVSVVETPIDVSTIDGEIIVSLNPSTVTVEASTTGPQGPQGLQGVQGPAGDKLVAYRHIQTESSDTWTVTHNLNFYPNVTVIDSAGTICEGDIAYPSQNQLIITFAGAFSGEAFLS